MGILCSLSFEFGCYSRRIELVASKQWSLMHSLNIHKYTQTKAALLSNDYEGDALDNQGIGNDLIRSFRGMNTVPKYMSSIPTSSHGSGIAHERRLNLGSIVEE